MGGANKVMSGQPGHKVTNSSRHITDGCTRSFKRGVVRKGGAVGQIFVAACFAQLLSLFVKSESCHLRGFLFLSESCRLSGQQFKVSQYYIQLYGWATELTISAQQLNISLYELACSYPQKTIFQTLFKMLLECSSLF